MKLTPPTTAELKDATLKMEVEHAQRLGLSSTVAEAENVRMLERSEQIAKLSKPAQKRAKGAPNIGHAERKATRGVTTKSAPPILAGKRLSPCGRCGTCRRCLREKRVFAMSQKAKQGDHKFAVILWQLGMYAQQAQDGTGRFAGLSPRDANRMVIRRLEEVCDATVPAMGPWR